MKRANSPHIFPIVFFSTDSHIYICPFVAKIAVAVSAAPMYILDGMILGHYYCPCSCYHDPISAIPVSLIKFSVSAPHNMFSNLSSCPKPKRIPIHRVAGGLMALESSNGIIIIIIITRFRYGLDFFPLVLCDFVSGVRMKWTALLLRREYRLFQHQQLFHFFVSGLLSEWWGDGGVCGIQLSRERGDSLLL